MAVGFRRQSGNPHCRIKLHKADISPQTFKFPLDALECRGCGYWLQSAIWKIAPSVHFRHSYFMTRVPFSRPLGSIGVEHQYRSRKILQRRTNRLENRSTARVWKPLDRAAGEIGKSAGDIVGLKDSA